MVWCGLGGVGWAGVRSGCGGVVHMGCSTVLP